MIPDGILQSEYSLDTLLGSSIGQKGLAVLASARTVREASHHSGQLSVESSVKAEDVTQEAGIDRE